MTITLEGLGPNNGNSLFEGCFLEREKPCRNPKGVYTALSLHMHPLPVRM